MFNEVEGMIQRATSGEIDQSSVSQAAEEHISAIDPSQLTQHLQTAADNANQNGQSGAAQQIMGLLSQHRSNLEGLKGQVVSLITSNPEILQHFEPGFAKGILGRI